VAAASESANGTPQLAKIERSDLPPSPSSPLPRSLDMRAAAAKAASERAPCWRGCKKPARPHFSMTKRPPGYMYFHQLHVPALL
jgi:hypothetical protein